VDWTVTFGNLLTIVAMAAAALGAFFFQRTRIEAATARIDALQRVLEVKLAAVDAAHAESFAIARRARDDLNAFRLHVTESYVQHPNMEKVEGRLLAAIDRLTSEISGLRSEFRRPDG